jgi:hypothetical protein
MTLLATPRVDRAVLFVNRSFTPAERASTDRLAGDVDLIDFDALAAWVSRSDDHNDVATEVTEIIREVSGRLGFLVELTPAAKDGGKDIVLECLAGYVTML